MAKVYLPTLMRRFADSQTSVAVEGTTVSAVLSGLVDSYPGLKPQVYDGGGSLHKHLIIVLNDDDVRSLGEGLDHAVDSRDEVRILPAMAGG
jgi:sulfur-carrier protein